MKERKTTKNTIALLLILALTLLAAGCGGKENNVSADNDVSGEATEITVEETETEEDTQAAEPTEVGTEAVDTEEEVLAIGTLVITTEEMSIISYPSHVECGPRVAMLPNGATVNIIGEYSNEDEQLDFYWIRLENGEEGYVEKQFIQLAE